MAGLKHGNGRLELCDDGCTFYEGGFGRFAYGVRSVSFDGKGLLASGSGDGKIKLWNTKTGECLRTLSGHGDSVWSVSFDRECLLASASLDGTIKLWNTKTGESLKSLTGHGYGFYSVSFDGEGLLASVSGDGTIKLWN